MAKKSDEVTTRKPKREVEVGVFAPRSYSTNDLAPTLTDSIFDPMFRYFDSLNTARNTRMRDSISFFVMVLRLVVGAFILGAAPEYFKYWYAAWVFIGLVPRWFYYKYCGYHYFFFDNCYFMTCFIMTYLFIYPDSQFMFEAAYATAHGSMIWTITIFGWRQCFHAWDSMVSILFHFEGPVLMLMMSIMKPAGYNTEFSESIFGTWTAASIVYGIWSVYYFTSTLVLFYNRMKQRDYDSMYLWQMSANGAISKLLKTFGEKNSKVMFCVCHAIGHITLQFIGSLARNPVYAIIQLTANFLPSLWNGSVYYFHQFPKRYEARLESLKTIKTN